MVGLATSDFTNRATCDAGGVVRDAEPRKPRPAESECGPHVGMSRGSLAGAQERFRYDWSLFGRSEDLAKVPMVFRGCRPRVLRRRARPAMGITSRRQRKMRLIRGWEERYSPRETGGVRPCKASVYRKIGEEDGVGDHREGEVRTKVDGGNLSVEWEPMDGLPAGLRRAMEEHEGSAAEDEEMRALLAERSDDPELALQRTGPGKWSMSQNVIVNDDEIPSPYLFCLTREPSTTEEWESLRAELPERYDTWTVTADVNAVQFEIECGIRRWLRIERITRHRIVRASGWVTYAFEAAPPTGDPTEVFRMSRWFRKRTKYQAQAEYRLAWSLSSDQREDMLEAIDVELTRTGLRLFEPWTPPVG